MIKNTNEFQKFLEKYKCFRELPEQYKSIKFCKLYMRIYNYMVSIPKEKIVISHLIRKQKCIAEYINYIFSYLRCFLEAKDFYNWKDRIYSLMTEKLCTISYKKYELLYRSKAKEFYDKRREKCESTCLEIYGAKYPLQSKEVKEKVINKLVNKSKEEKEQIQEKRKATCLKIYGKENPAQSKVVQDKFKATWNSKTPEEKKNINNKRKENTKNIWKNRSKEEKKNIGSKISKSNKNWWKNLSEEKRNELLVKLAKKGTNIKSHSKIGDKICLVIDNALGNPEDSMYATKNGEFFLNIDSKHIRKYDYCIPSKKLIVEVDDPYWHALDNNPDDILVFHHKKILAKDIWQYDKEKEELANSKGYKVFHIRDDEYYKDPETCINNLLEQIREYFQ